MWDAHHSACFLLGSTVVLSKVPILSRPPSPLMDAPVTCTRSFQTCFPSSSCLPAPDPSQLPHTGFHMVGLAPPPNTHTQEVYRLTLSAHLGSFSSVCPSWPLSVKGTRAFQASLLHSDFSFALVFFFDIALLSALPFLPPPPGCQASVLLPTGCLDCSLLSLPPSVLLTTSGHLQTALPPHPADSASSSLLVVGTSCGVFSACPSSPVAPLPSTPIPAVLSIVAPEHRCPWALPFPFPIILPSALPFTQASVQTPPPLPAPF